MGRYYIRFIITIKYSLFFSGVCCEELKIINYVFGLRMRALQADGRIVEEPSFSFFFVFALSLTFVYVDYVEFVRLFAGNIGYLLFQFIFAISPYFLLKLQINSSSFLLLFSSNFVVVSCCCWLLFFYVAS